MNLISFFKRPNTSAPVARERLKLMLAHERAAFGASDVIALLQDEIVAVIAKHFPVEPEAIKIRMDRGDAISTLEVEVEIPTPLCVNISLNAPKPKPELKAVDSEPDASSGPRPDSLGSALANAAKRERVDLHIEADG
jgi:cell division topological specificity factor